MSHFPEATRLAAGLMVSLGPEVSVPRTVTPGAGTPSDLSAQGHLLSLQVQGSCGVVQPLRNMKTG